MRLPLLAAFAALIPLSLLPAAAGRPAAIDFRIELAAMNVEPGGPPDPVPNGGTVTVAGPKFFVSGVVGMSASATAFAKTRYRLGDGLRWDEDTDPSEGCTGTTTTVDCTDWFLVGGPLRDGSYWEVTAERPGTYSFEGEIVETSDADPDASNNRSRITIVVREATLATSAIRLSPARPKAGSTVNAFVLVTYGDAPLRPTRVACAGAIGKLEVKGAPSATSGQANCSFRTPRAAKGKRLTGSVSFTARGQRFTKRFAARLR